MSSVSRKMTIEADLDEKGFLHVKLDTTPNS